MSFGDPYTIDDLLREIHHPASGDRVTLTREQALDLERGPDPDEVALEAAYGDGMTNAECDLEHFDGMREVEWRHCSPELLGAGVSCAATPRRVCDCGHTGPCKNAHVGHDHLIDASWLAQIVARVIA